MPTYPHVLRAESIQAYSPANHTGTSNQRVISKDTVGARYVELLIGTISKGNGALKHAHPNLEQASYMLQGEGRSEVYGQERHFGLNAWSFNPQGVFHRFTVTSDEPVRVMVVYAPPYHENPLGAVTYDPANPQAEPAARVAQVGAARDFTLPEQAGLHYTALIDPQSHGAQHLSIYRVSASPGARTPVAVLAGRERVLYVLRGRLSGTVDAQAFTAGAGDFVFIPEGGSWSLHLDAADAAAEFFLIDAFADQALPV